MRSLGLLSLLWLLSCARPATTLQPTPDLLDAGAVGDAGTPCGCQAFSAPRVAGPIAEPALVELSGLALSRAHPGVLWAHNDSGDTARFFALSLEGGALGEFALDGGAAKDWEDVAVGPCGATTCVFLGDMGDNLRKRTDYAVYRVAEGEAVPQAGAPARTISAYERLPFAYPGGEKNNAETLLVHPVTGRIYLVTKEAGGVPSRLFRFPEGPQPGVEATLELVGELPVPAAGDSQVTGGSLSPCGGAVLLRMYNRLVVLRWAAGEGPEAMVGSAPQTVPAASEEQGEAVAWAADGKGYFTSSEVVTTPNVLSRVDCR